MSDAHFIKTSSPAASAAVAEISIRILDPSSANHMSTGRGSVVTWTGISLAASTSLAMGGPVNLVGPCGSLGLWRAPNRWV